MPSSRDGTTVKIAKIQKTTFYEVNDRVYAWFVNTSKRNIPITGPLIQERASADRRVVSLGIFLPRLLAIKRTPDRTINIFL